MNDFFANGYANTIPVTPIKIMNANRVQELMNQITRNYVNAPIVDDWFIQNGDKKDIKTEDDYSYEDIIK